LALGQDERKVEPWENAKSIGSEETFEKDLTDKEEMRTILLELAEQVGGRLRREGQAARTITLKIRFASFLTLTRRRTLNEPTQLDETIYRNAAEMLEKEKLNEGIRLLGVTLSGLDEARQPEIRLFDDGEAKGRALAAAADTIRAKFGHRMVVHGRLANKAKKGEVDDD
jgi:DNA polymerase-4